MSLLLNVRISEFICYRHTFSQHATFRVGDNTLLTIACLHTLILQHSTYGASTQLQCKTTPLLLLFLWRFDPIPGHGLPLRGLAITLRHTTLGSTSLDKWSARHIDLYLTTHNTHKTQTSMPSGGFETTNPAIEWQQTRALNPSAIGIRHYYNAHIKILVKYPLNIKREHLDILPSSYNIKRGIFHWASIMR